MNELTEFLYNPNAKPAKELSEHDQRMIQLGWDASQAKSVTRVCPDCKGSGKLPTGRQTADYPCLYCSGTGKIAKTIEEIVEEWIK